jgi:putative zinc finger/helix-turn-helix YgiT family protein
MAINTTSIGGRCSMCGHSPLEPKLIDKTFEYGEDDDAFIVTAHQVPVEVCPNCGEYCSGPAAARVEHDAICQALGLMTPTEIKALREQLGWSQQYLADLTGLGIATVSRWERGRLLQSRSNNKVLLALRDCAPFRDCLKQLLASKVTHSVGSGQAPISLPEVHREGKNAELDRAPATESGTGGDPTWTKQQELKPPRDHGGTSGQVNRIKSRYSSPEEHVAYAAAGNGLHLFSRN